MDGKVMILDNSSYERQKIKHLLEKTGLTETIEVQNLNQFKLLNLEQCGLKLVIIDIAFPTEEEGFEALSIFRGNKAAESVPIIVVTRLDGVEPKNGALKYSVDDYIVKPYQVRRLESSIRSLVKPGSSFHFDTAGIDDIKMSFDNYILKEMNYSKRTKSKLSFILITTLKLGNNQSREPVRNGRKETILTMAAEMAGKFLRSTDMIVSGKNRDMLVILPFTDEAGARQVSDKIKSRIFSELKKINADISEYLYPVHITYPDDGNDFQKLMEAAYNRVADKEMLEKIVSIPSGTRKYAEQSYNQYKKWSR